MKALKYALLGSGVVALFVASAIAYLVLTFDPRDYQPRITELVKEKTGRTLQIAGEMKLSFWPDLGVRLGAVSLSERESDEPFADAANVRFTIELRRLLSRELVARNLGLQGAHVRITRFADGRLNIDDLLKSEGPTPSFDIGGIKVERSQISYRDIRVGKAYHITALELETGRITNVSATPVKLSATVRDGESTFELSGALDARLSLDLEQQHYALTDASVRLAGNLAGLSQAAGQVKGNFSANAKSGELEASKVSAMLAGELNDQQLGLTAAVMKLSSRAGRVVAATGTATLHTTSAAGTARVTLASPLTSLAADTVVADVATVEVESRRGEHAVEASVASRLEVDTAARTVALPKLKAHVSVRGPGLPGKGLAGVVNGSALVDLARETVRTAVAGTVAGSRIKADIRASGFGSPTYRFAVDIDQLDADRYQPAAGSRRDRDAEKAFDLSMLSKVPATGTLHIGTLTTGGLKARHVTLAVKP